MSLPRNTSVILEPLNNLQVIGATASVDDEADRRIDISFHDGTHLAIEMNYGGYEEQDDVIITITDPKGQARRIKL